MKRSRFSEEQIIGILKEHQAGLGWARRSCAASMGSAMRRSTSGAPSMAAWRCQTRGG